MKAFVVNRYGGPENAGFADVPAPEPATAEVRVRVAAAGLNPIDFKMRQGLIKALFAYSLPAVMGNELAGTVEKVGPGVTSLKLGDRVAARVEKGRQGAFAELAVVGEQNVVKLPDSLSTTEAAGIPLAGLTALQVLRDELALKPGQRILITGGAGGVGTFAIQVAKALGATVITTASPRGSDLVRSLGADQVIDYTSVDFSNTLTNLDGAFDTVGGEDLAKCFRVVKRGGKVVSVAGAPEPKTAGDIGAGVFLRVIFWFLSRKLRALGAQAGVSYRYLFMHPSGSDLGVLLNFWSLGKLRVVTDRVLPFSRLPEAFTALESGRAKGKIIVTMD